MLINEASKIANLTKKAIEYYMEQNLISPAILENGYRDFDSSDIERLKKISVLRKLGLCIEDIKNFLVDENTETLKRLSVKSELHLQREQAKNAILENLLCGKSYDEIYSELLAIDQNATITEKLLDAFPGTYGRYLTLHWAPFLNDPIRTDEQKQAYEDVITFLDNTPSLNFPEDVQTCLDEATFHRNATDIKEMNDKIRQAVENPDKFITESKEALEAYMSFIQSDEYKNSPLYQMKRSLFEFNKRNGYYDIFIPAMKRLSPSYAEYCNQMEAANEKLLAQYPEAETLDLSKQ